MRGVVQYNEHPMASRTTTQALDAEVEVGAEDVQGAVGRETRFRERDFAIVVNHDLHSRRPRRTTRSIGKIWGCGGVFFRQV